MDQQKPLSLDELLLALSSLDDAATLEFDPAQIVGDLKGKVDAIHTVIGRLDAEQDRLAGIASQFSKAAAGVYNNARRLEAYLLASMQKHNYEKLPGELFRVQVQSGADALDVERNPSADDYVKDPDLVTRKVSYAWNKDKAKEKLLAGESLPDMKLKPVKYLRWYVQKKG